MIHLAVSILNHNSAKSTVACVNSLRVANEPVESACQLEIFVSDNASNPDDRSQLREALSDYDVVSLQFNDENLGFSTGHNRNLETIFAGSTPDYVWILNNDCMVGEGALGALLECAERHPQVGIWGATLLEPDGETIQCAGGCFYNTWISSYRQYGKGKSLSRIDKLAPKKFDYVAGASLFFPVATLHSGLTPLPETSTGGRSNRRQWLNEEFFLYFEELDLAQRLKSHLEMGWCKDALIRHAGGAGTGTHANQKSAKAEYHSTLSALRFTRSYFPGRLWLMAPARYLAKCLVLLARGEFRLIGMMTRAYRDF